MAGNCMRQANNEIITSEWEDVQYKYGNKVGKYATKEQEIMEQKQLKEVVDNFLDTYNPLEHQTVEQLDRMLEEDGRADEDEDALVAYRNKRKQEMLERQRATRFGYVKHITKPQYVDEVSKAGEGIWVLCCLIEEGHDACDWLLRIMGELADRHKELKMVSIKSTDASANFPESHLPTVLVYQSGEMKKQVTGLEAWSPAKGKNPSADAAEEYLKKIGPLKSKRHLKNSTYSDDESEEADVSGDENDHGGKCYGTTSKFSIMRNRV